MKNKFKDSKILIVNDMDASRKMQMNILKVLGFTTVDFAYEMTDGFRNFQGGKHDVIMASLDNGKTDAIGLAKMIRNDAASPNKFVPIIAVAGPQAMHLMDNARENGITELLMAPYSVNDVSQKLNFALSLEQEALETAAEPQEPPSIPADTAPQGAPDQEPPWPAQEEAFSLTDMLLDHYLRHHEIVLMKLKFAQSATKHCIDEVRQTHEKIRERDNTNISDFKDFDKMWEDILSTFIQGGMSEEELFQIEKIITSVPKDIKEHYDALSAQDKTFLTLVENLNSNAYKKAKEKVATLQEKPNPYNGKSSDDYKQITPKTPVAKAIPVSTEEARPVVIFEPRHKK